MASIAFSVYRALTSVAMIIMSSSTPGNLSNYNNIIIYYYCNKYYNFPLIAATGNVHELISSLSSTGRRHVCAKDLLTFSCEISGLYLSWVVDGAHRTILFGDQRVDTIQTVSQGKAILTMNEEIEGDTESRRRLRSALLIDSSQYYIGYHNLSCSSDRDTQNLTFREGGKSIMLASVHLVIVTCILIISRNTNYAQQFDSKLFSDGTICKLPGSDFTDVECTRKS